MENIRKITIIRAILLLGTAISLYFVPWMVLWAWIRPLPDTVEDQVQEALDYGFEGIIVYVDKAGQNRELFAAGWHDRDRKITADPQAFFKIASIGKLYHAVAITRLVHTDKISLDATVDQYFPELKGKIENTRSITIRMLVQHRSGLPNFTNTADFWVNPPASKKETLERVYGIPANFQPGSQYEYCNTNYLLLSMLIERVTGKTDFDFIRDQFLQPLNLNSTYGSIGDVDMSRVMSGYYVGVAEDIKTTNYGSMVATAEDVGVFLRALNEGTIFQPGEQELYSSLYEYSHTGLIPGYQSIAKYHPELDAIIVQFTNTTNFDGYEWNLSEVVYSRIKRIIETQ
jgi:CubicO group peptidase (beta-lactamase class C family)